LFLFLKNGRCFIDNHVGTGSLSLKRVLRKDVERRSGLSLVLRLALCVPVCVLTATRADNSTARAATGGAAEEESLSCGEAIAAAEVSYGIPWRLLRAVALVESGREDPKTGTVVPWPWTLNVDGESRYHASKAEALKALLQSRDRGIENVDVGCMQINLHYHQGVFTSMDQALDPKRNTQYGASFLRALYAATGSWADAVRRYHSATPDMGESYAARVMAVWRKLGGHPVDLRLPPATSAAGQYVRADFIARFLRNAGLPVPTEILYLQRRGRLSASGSAMPKNRPEDLRPKTDEGSEYDATAARERFLNPWASPADEEDTAVRTGPQSHSETIRHRTSRSGSGVSKYGGARGDRKQQTAPTSRFDRHRGLLR
jgi:hypothetical protein